MTHARFRTAWICLGLSAALPGCAGTGPLTSHRTSVGTLKASVSRLEYENQQLRRDVASLQSENREFENRLVQEEALNGDLAARLDDARTLLGQRGPVSSTADDALLDPGPAPPRRTLPAGRSNQKPRKPPFAQIHGRIDAAPPADETDEDDDIPLRSGWRGESGPLSRRNDPTVWLPIARGATDPTPRRR